MPYPSRSIGTVQDVLAKGNPAFAIRLRSLQNTTLADLRAGVESEPELVIIGKISKSHFQKYLRIPVGPLRAAEIAIAKSPVARAPARPASRQSPPGAPKSRQFAFSNHFKVL